MNRPSHDLQNDSPDHTRWQLQNIGTVQFVLAIGIATGIVLLLASNRTSPDGARRLLHAYLVGFAFCLSLSLGSLFFLIVQHLFRAGWSVAVRRPAEIFAANIGIVALMFIPIAWSVSSGQSSLYSWAQSPPSLETTASVEAPGQSAHEIEHGSSAHSSPLGPEKRFMLNPAFFLARCVVYLVIWSGLAFFFWNNSVRQDRDGSAARTVRMEWIAAPAALLFGVSVTWGAFDLLMSLNPRWQSTMFGVYFFAGSVVGGLSLITLTTIWLRQRGQLPKAVGTDHFMDFGRLMFGFVFFWAYIAFSQYMLLWYANLPAELTWLRMRGASTAAGEGNSWSWLLLFLLVGHFLLPFAGLMSRHTKKRPRLLAIWAGWLLVLHFLDLVWVVMPELGPTIQIGAAELGAPLLLFSIYLTTAILLARPSSLVPVGDPRLGESLRYESAY